MFYETGPREQDKYLYPPAVQALGWFFELSPTVLTLVYPAWVLYRSVLTSGEFISYFFMACHVGKMQCARLRGSKQGKARKKCRRWLYA